MSQVLIHGKGSVIHSLNESARIFRVINVGHLHTFLRIPGTGVTSQNTSVKLPPNKLMKKRQYVYRILLCSQVQLCPLPARAPSSEKDASAT